MRELPLRIPHHRPLAVADSLQLHGAVRRKAEALARLTSSADLEDYEQARLELAVQRGNDARNLLVENNLRLVAGIARGFRVSPELTGDLFQEGVFGLVRAIERFDPGRGLALSTFATPWIARSMARWLGRHRSHLTLPEAANQLIRQADRIAAELPVEARSGSTCRQLAGMLDVRTEHLELVLAAGAPALPLDALGASRKSRRQEELHGSCDAEADALDRCDGALHQYLALLDDRERVVLTGRLGFVDDAPRSFADLALELGVTGERARQLFARACAKLAHPSVALQLKSDLEGR